MTEEERNELWQQYADKKTSDIREKLIIEYLYIVKAKAAKLYIDLNFNVEYDELFSFGVFGLIDAIDKFDIKRGLKFQTYANTRVYGSIIDHVRKIDWIPRTIRQKQKDIEKAFKKIEAEKKRTPTDEEIATELNISLSKLEKWYRQTNILDLVSLDGLIEQKNSDALSLSNYEYPERTYIKNETKEQLMKAISELTEKQKVVIFLYYFNDLTDESISKKLKVTVSNVTGMRMRALKKLKSSLCEYINT